MTAVNHRARAEDYLNQAEVERRAGHRDPASAMIAIAHALLAGPANHCQACGIEREVQHDEWCEFKERAWLTQGQADPTEEQGSSSSNTAPPASSAAKP